MNRAAKFVSALVMATSLLQADWVPEDCLLDLDPVQFQALNEPSYRTVKDKVIQSLKGSWCTEEKSNLLMDLIYLTKPDVCVEIGAFTGSSVLPVAVALKSLHHGHVYAIDAWSTAEATKGLADNDPNKAWWGSLQMKEIKAMFDQMIKHWNLSSVCTAIPLPSEKAVEQIGTIDFLHLDGNFSEAGSLKDVELYLPKVKEGGYILLSNLFLMSNGKQPKLKSFSALFDGCEMICEIERGSAVLFRKQ